ncbi:hypothetical protein N0V90_010188 [Kalmusia sp. IMI 367209]|nr:hypothetical protein N0V90_010188 [Kalmusia sp. IMI 367209]
MCTPTARRGASKKVTSRGRRWVDIHFGPTRLPIEVHEDLLCAHSPHFRNLLQSSRKPLDAHCCVCKTSLDASEDNITYCKSCGQNMHNDCIDRWLEKNTRCPLCRAIWSREDKHETVRVEGLDRDGFGIWVKCLYGSELPKLRNESMDADTFDAHIIRLMKASMAANMIQDVDFQDAVMVQMATDIESYNTLPGLLVARYLFSDKDRDAEFTTLRAFIIDVYALMWTAGDEAFWCGNYDIHGVAEFMSHLLMAQGKAKGSNLAANAMDDLVKKYLLTEIEDTEQVVSGIIFHIDPPSTHQHGAAENLETMLIVSAAKREPSVQSRSTTEMSIDNLDTRKTASILIQRLAYVDPSTLKSLYSSRFINLQARDSPKIFKMKDSTLAQLSDLLKYRAFINSLAMIKPT